MAETVEDVKMDGAVVDDEPSSDSLVPDSAEEKDAESAEEPLTDGDIAEKPVSASADSAQTSHPDRKCMHCSSKKPRALGKRYMVCVRSVCDSFC